MNRPIPALPVPTGLAQTETVQKTYFEVAVYAVKDPKTFSDVRRRAMDRLWCADGFQGWLPLLSLEGDELFADVLAWASPEEAERASQAMQTDPELVPFVEALAEVRSFGRYWAPVDRQDLWLELAEAPVVEIAVYSVEEPGGHRAAHRDLYARRLPVMAGYRLGTLLVADGEEATVGDLVAWDSIEAQQHARQSIQSDPATTPFFGQIATTTVRALFTPEPEEIR